jgi:hypothetical protein
VKFRPVMRALVGGDFAHGKGGAGQGPHFNGARPGNLHGPPWEAAIFNGLGRDFGGGSRIFACRLGGKRGPFCAPIRGPHSMPIDKPGLALKAGCGGSAPRVNNNPLRGTLCSLRSPT